MMVRVKLGVVVFLNLLESRTPGKCLDFCDTVL